MSKTMSIRMDRENFEFLNELTKEQKSDLSKAVRDMVTRGRILLALERYKEGEASLIPYGAGIFRADTNGNTRKWSREPQINILTIAP